MNFHPWTGDRFGKHNGMGLPSRVLLVGESHYDSKELPDITSQVVDEVLDGEYKLRFLTTLFKAICGPDTSATIAEFYNAVAFYNFVQYMLEGPGKRPTKEMWQHGAEVFPSCLDLLKPSHAVTCGFVLWDGLPDERFSEPSQLKQDILPHLPEQYQRVEKHRKRGWIGQYAYEDGTSCLIMKIEHPSSRRFSPIAWHPVLRWFLQLEE